MKIDNLTKITGLSMAALLALTACGDDDGGNGADDANGGEENGENAEEAAQNVYDFETLPNEEQHRYEEVTVTVPEELHGADAVSSMTDEVSGEVIHEEQTYAEAALVDSITLRSAEAEEQGMCAIEAEYDFAVEDPVEQNWTADDGSTGHADGREIIEESDGYVVYQWNDEEVYDDLVGENLSIDEDFLETHTLTEETTCDDTVTFEFQVAREHEHSGGDYMLDRGMEDESGVNQYQEAAEALDGISWTTFDPQMAPDGRFDIGYEFATVEVRLSPEGEFHVQGNVDGWMYSEGGWVQTDD